MTMFALVLFTVTITNFETKDFRVDSKPIGTYPMLEGEKGCMKALEKLEPAIPTHQEAKCLRISRR